MSFLDCLYEVRDDERELFGPHWCGPVTGFKYGENVRVARYDSTDDSDGQSAEVWCSALPARCYEVRVFPGVDSSGRDKPAWPVVLSTGSGREMAELCDKIAIAIATGMLGIREVSSAGDASK